MQICRTIKDIRKAVTRFKHSGESVGLVTTMGALHAGHLSLVENASANHTRVVATIFVNPTQFGETADLDAYPRTEDADCALLEAAGVDAVFIPSVDEMYPNGEETIVETTRLANILHGQVRPGHFRGVTTVVSKLFNIVGADAAYFGEKDYQQLNVIKQMVKDLHMPIDIHGVATMRDPDGLAMSSRNARLSEQDRQAGLVLSRSLDMAEKLAINGAKVEDLTQAIKDAITSEPRSTLRACDIVWADSFEPASGPITQKIGIMLSAEFGGVLLLDQREITP